MNHLLALLVVSLKKSLSFLDYNTSRFSANASIFPHNKTILYVYSYSLD